MSWDVLLLRLSDDLDPAAPVAEDLTPVPLGRSEEVLAAVRRAAPETDLSDPRWGELRGPGWSVELNLGDEDPVDTVMLHVRGAGDDVLDAVFRLADALNCRVLDCSSMELVTPDTATAGWHAFQKYRDAVTGGPAGT